jgi:hypothetical protein
MLLDKQKNVYSIRQQQNEIYCKTLLKSCVLMERVALMEFGFLCCNENSCHTKTITGKITPNVIYEMFSNLPKSIHKSY